MLTYCTPRLPYTAQVLSQHFPHGNTTHWHGWTQAVYLPAFPILRALTLSFAVHEYSTTTWRRDGAYQVFLSGQLSSLIPCP